jgi:hypothetical protein
MAGIGKISKKKFSWHFKVYLFVLKIGVAFSFKSSNSSFMKRAWWIGNMILSPCLPQLTLPAIFMHVTTI